MHPGGGGDIQRLDQFLFVCVLIFVCQAFLFVSGWANFGPFFSASPVKYPKGLGF
jgi:hypothetical protein